MEELVRILQEYKEKGASLKSCTIVLDDGDGYFKYLITSNLDGYVHVEDIP